jgi:hypothetical protein
VLLQKRHEIITTAIKKPKSPHPPFRKGGMGGFGKFMYLNAVVIASGKIGGNLGYGGIFICH